MKKINATAPQPQRNVLKYFAIFKNIAHSLEPGETLCTTLLNIAKHDEITTQFQFTETATEPQRNRIFRQFNNDKYRIDVNTT